MFLDCFNCFHYFSQKYHPSYSKITQNKSILNIRSILSSILLPLPNPMQVWPVSTKVVSGFGDNWIIAGSSQARVLTWTQFRRK